jgi:hypothetical protein
MNRSVGVTVIAVLALLGSILALLMGTLMAVVMAVAPVPTQPEFPASPTFFKVILLGASLVYLLPAVWGILTSIGLFRLRNWARISIIVFAVVLILMSISPLLGSLMFSFISFPRETLNPSAMTVVRLSIGAMGLGQLSVGIWWLVFFNRAKVKQQFPSQPSYSIQTQPAAFTEIRSIPQRPLSLTIIAWLLAVSCSFIPLSLALRAPAVPFTKVLTGWPAGVVNLLIGLMLLYIGVGLLKLKPAALKVGIGYFLFTTVNSAVFLFAPGGRARLTDLMERQQEMFPLLRFWQTQSAWRLDSTPFAMIGACAGFAYLAALLYFLITRKEAFESAARAQ